MSPKARCGASLRREEAMPNDAFRLPGSRPRRKGRARARRVRFGRRQVRPDERPDVAGAAPLCGSASPSTRPACAKGCACSTSPAAPATSRACLPTASGAAGEVVLTDINGAMLARGRDRLVNAGRLVPAVQCDAEKLPFAGAASTASASPSGCATSRARKRRSRRWCACSSRAVSPPCWSSRTSMRRSRRRTTGTASTSCRGWASWSPATTRATVISPSRSGCTRTRRR